MKTHHRSMIFPICFFIFFTVHVTSGFGVAFGQTQTAQQSFQGVQNPGRTIDNPKGFGIGTSPEINQLKKKDKTGADAASPAKNIANQKEIIDEKQQEKERDIMEEALHLLSESHAHWEKGDLENALEMLDQAYALILDTDGDPDIARQKDDLRLLISQKIVAIYSSMRTSTSGKRSEIPYAFNEDVEKEIRLFQTVERDFFIQSYRRSGIYRPMIVRELKKAGLPEELTWLPLVESGFKTHALSSARALGLWQFIPSTGYKFGLNRDEWVDERLDVDKSTRAAIDYLRELHGMFGDWLTVLAAYNCGEGRVLRVISRQHINYFDRFWDLYNQLPRETARYVPRFLATLHIIKDPGKYGMKLDSLDQPHVYETVRTSKPMRLQDIASRMGIAEEVLIAMNSELRQKVTPDKEYNLKVPLATSETFVKIVDDIPHYEKPRQQFIRYRAKRGETVVTIAKKYGIPAGVIMHHNNLSSRKKLKAGQRLIIPIEGHSYARLKNNAPSESKRKVSDDLLRYKVKKGDTLSSIAKRYDLSVDELGKMNKLKKNKIRTGQIIVVKDRSTHHGGEKKSDKTSQEKILSAMSKGKSEEPPKARSRTYVVKRGDNISSIARDNGINLEKLLEMNKLSQEDTIIPGQVIIVR